jgi:tetratricopeptide (TPR) repeat protein
VLVLSHGCTHGLPHQRRCRRCCCHCCSRVGLSNLNHLAAEVCERYGWLEEALLHAERAVSFGACDPATDQRPTTRVMAHALRGRALAALGRLDEAEQAFEASIAVSTKCELWLTAAFAMRDLQAMVLKVRAEDGTHAAAQLAVEGARRLEATVARLMGSTDEITAMMGHAEATRAAWKQLDACQ